jgi:CorA-like Mg2+ transporter protein
MKHPVESTVSEITHNPPWSPHADKQKSSLYADFVRRCAEKSREFCGLSRFLDQGQPIDKKGIATCISLVHLAGDGQIQQVIHYPADLRKALEERVDNGGVNRLVLVENIDPESVGILGKALEIDPQFFADHLENSFWYGVNDIPDHLPPLPSVDAKQGWMRLRFPTARTIIRRDHRQLLFERPDDVYIVHSNEEESMKTGAIFQQTARQDKPKSNHLVMFAHASLAIWVSELDQSSWTGRSLLIVMRTSLSLIPAVILLDPPFMPREIDVEVKDPEYRTFRGRPFPPDNPGDRHPTRSFREAYAACLGSKEKLPQTISNYPFAVFQDLYSIVASEWIVVNTYLKRELLAVEWNLENTYLNIQELDNYMRSLFVYRRRIMAYINFAREQQEMLSKYGRKAWLLPRTSIPPDVEEIRNDLQCDFTYVISFLEINSDRVDKNIKLITSLLAVSESKASRINNRSVAALTGMGTVFLPFSVVASIMSIQGDYGPGQTHFWIFWIVSLLVTGAVALGLVLYNGALKRDVPKADARRPFTEKYIK